MTTFSESDRLRWLETWGFKDGTPEAEQAWKEKLEMHGMRFSGHYVLGDIQPYQSQITGEMIEGRRQHKEHLKNHGCIEIGNEVQQAPARKPDTRLKERLARIVYEKLRY